MSTARKRILSFALAVCLLLAMTLVVPGPVAVAAEVGIEDSSPSNVTVGNGGDSGPDAADVTVLAFGGKEWYVIGYKGDGVYSSGNTMTLLAKDNIGSNTDFGTTYEYSNYENQELHNAIWAIHNTMNSREQGMFEVRDLDDTYDAPVSNQPLWPLSVSEAEAVSYSVRNAASASWWLRSPGDLTPENSVAFVGSGLVNFVGHGARDNQLGVRPAFRLDLSSVLFTSDASGASAKSSATVGSTLLSAAKPQTDTIKFTVEDDVNLGLTITDDSPIIAASGEQVDIVYTGASTGADHSVSVIIADNSGKPLFYGRPSSAASGTASFDLPSAADLPDGTYKLLVFNEEVRGVNETDFASTPKEITLTVNNPTAAELKVDDITFPPLPLGYNQPAAEVIIIKNEGGTDATITNVSVSDATKFTVIFHSNTTVLSGGGNTDWQVRPKEDLGVGPHSATITVTYTGGTSAPSTDTATAQVEFEVQAAPAPGEYTVALTANPPAGGNPRATPINAASGTQITLEANPNTGYTFDRWESNDVQFASQTQLTTFTMPDKAVEITGFYKLDENPPTGTAPSITTDSLPDGKVGEAYSETLTATGDTPINWTVSGNLPLGLSLSGDEISGTPKQAGIFGFIVKAENAHGEDTKALSIKITPDEGGTGPTDPTDPTNPTIPGGNGGGSSGSRSRSSSSSGRSTPGGQVAKTTLPASAFSWEGRTLTIDHDSISVLGLLSVQWGGKTLIRGTDYGVYQGSVIVRFSEDFIATQSPGEHTVKVEFLNRTGETTVTVGDTSTGGVESNDDLFMGDTHNPNTGGYPDGSDPGTTDNPNTGDGRGIWLALLLGSIGAAVLVKLRPRLEVK